MDADNPSAPGKNWSGKLNIPMAMTVSATVLSHKIHFGVEVAVVMTLGLGFVSGENRNFILAYDGWEDYSRTTIGEFILNPLLLDNP